MPIADMNNLISEVNSGQIYLRRIAIDDLLGYFDKLSKFWLTNKHMLSEQPYIKALAQFVSRNNLSKVLNVALRGNINVLDSFENLPVASSSAYYHCQPRGLVVHWLAGNASLLGFYSLFQAMLTKNVSIVKPSSGAYEDFLGILVTLNQVSTPKIKGGDLLKTVIVVQVDRKNIAWQTELSKNADVRIVWGGKEAVEAIGSLPKKIYAEDIVLGPKYSLGIIDKKSLAEHKKIAAKLALDIATFDQYACSSPHTIFVEKGGKTTPEKFAAELAASLAYVGAKLIRKNPPDARKNLDIVTLRAKYGMIGNIWSSLDTEWTVILSTEKGLGPACASRVIFVKPVDSVLEVANWIDRGKQTMGSALQSVTKKDILKQLTSKGIDRCVPYGRMTFFESPWDGMFIIDRLVRWVSYYEN